MKGNFKSNWLNWITCLLDWSVQALASIAKKAGLDSVVQVKRNSKLTVVYFVSVLDNLKIN